MLMKFKGAFNILQNHVQNNLRLLVAQSNEIYYNNQHIRKKHFNPKFKKERARKVMKVELPKFRNHEEMTSEERRSMWKKEGIIPHRKWHENPITVTCSTGIIEPYVVPEGEGKYSIISRAGAKQVAEIMGKKSKNLVALRQIKKHTTDFTTKTFLNELQDIYVKAHTALTKRPIDDEEIIQYVTEHAFPKFVHNADKTTIVWKFLESLEPPRLVLARISGSGDDQRFSQVTVRFHSQQILCIYDRFGRLMKGSEILRKDVLDYVVFERILTNEYSKWRIHAKIKPDWKPSDEPSARTFRVEKEDEDEIVEEKIIPQKAATDGKASQTETK